MKAFIKFNRGMLKMPLPWQLWLMSLVIDAVDVMRFIGGDRAETIQAI